LLTAEGCGRPISLAASNFVRDNSDATCRASTPQERVICALPSQNLSLNLINSGGGVKKEQIATFV